MNRWSKVFKVLKTYWILLCVLLFLIGISVAYTFGYRLDQAGITRVGSVTISPLPEGAAVYIDQSERVVPTNGSVELALLPGAHQLILDVPGHQPWNEVITVAPGGNTVLSPLIVKTTPGRSIVVGRDQESAQRVITALTLPTKEAPLVLEQGCAQVYFENGRILAELATSTCTHIPAYLSCAQDTGVCAPTIVFSPRDIPYAIFAYPGRDDALVVAAGTLVYVIEIDPREPQFFAPLYKGELTGAAPLSSTTIGIANGSQIIVLSL